MTDYVAVIATTPPAAPAKEWIVESPGIAERRNGNREDGKRDAGGNCGLIQLGAPLRCRVAACDTIKDRSGNSIRNHNVGQFETTGGTRLYNVLQWRLCYDMI